MSDIQRAFVAGATGLTGTGVVSVLRERGIATWAHVRPDSSRVDVFRERFEPLGAKVDVTPWEQDALRDTLRRLEISVVFALLGTTKRRARDAKGAGRDPSKESYEVVDYGLTAMLRRAAEAAGTKPRFIYLSSIGASATTGNEYMRVRGRIEEELRDGSLPYTSVRPSFIIGDRDEQRPFEAIGATFIDGGLSVLGALGGKRVRDRYRSITGPELAALLVRIGLDASFEGKVLELDSLRSFP